MSEQTGTAPEQCVTKFPTGNMDFNQQEQMAAGATISQSLQINTAPMFTHILKGRFKKKQKTKLPKPSYSL